MEATLFVNGHVWDGVRDARVLADLLVQGERIAGLSRQPGEFSGVSARRVDAQGATLIPGLVDAHGHLSFPMVTYPTEIEDTPPEESVLITMHNARTLLDAGFTGVIGAGSPKLRTELVVRNEITAGRIPGPRILASTPTLTATGGLNDTAQPHQGRAVAALVVDGPVEMRRAIRTCYREGVDVVKLNISGDDFFPRPGGRVTTLAEDEVQEAGRTAAELGMLLCAHARSAESIKRALRAGVTLLHHADFADEAALDLLEAARDRIFVGPTIGYYHALKHESPLGRDMLDRMGVDAAMAANIAVHTELRRRGIRAVIGGDYGLPWQPNGTNARDVAHFVTYLGYSPVEALRAATVHGAAAMNLGAGSLETGRLADVLLIEGDPTNDPAAVADPRRIRAVMKGGVFHKTPAPADRIARAA
ncbi:MAG TPA: amidohydrolase family protein [Acetobacteraceae bacterium]|nr:amidohydrolase family protein [Acetobacteraceae bacterium]